MVASQGYAFNVLNWARSMIEIRRHTLESFLAHDDATDVRRELVNGELVEMPPESRRNDLLAKFLIRIFETYFPVDTVSNQTWIAASGRLATARIPDITVVSEDCLALLLNSPTNVVNHDMPAPILVVEIVSPGQENRDLDYHHKHTEYAARAISEYWIVDPELQHVTLCTWNNGKYDNATYSGATAIRSAVIPHLELTAIEIFERRLRQSNRP